MIFGFNTDVKHGDIVYHVQSEAREADQLLQTQVFVRGRCIGKRATPYGDRASDPEFGDGQKEQVLREQHRLVLDSIRQGRVNDVIEQREAELAQVRQLDVQWINSDSVHSDHTLLMDLRVTEDGAGVEGARVTVRFARQNASPFYTQVLTDAGGKAQMKIETEESALPDAAILVQANYSGRTATRKFQLRKVEA